MKKLFSKIIQLRLIPIIVPFSLIHYKQSKYKINCQQFSEEFKILTKNDYYNKILQNKNDIFILIVYDNSEPINLIQSIRICKFLKQNSQVVDFNVNLISRQELNDVEQTVNSIKNFKIYDTNRNVDKIEIFLKTPFSDNFVFFKYKPHKFFQNQQKLFQKIQKFKKVTTNIESDFFQELESCQNRINSPLFIKVIKNKQDLQNYQNVAFDLLERKICPITSQFIYIEQNQKLIIKEFKLEVGETYILRNDLKSMFGQEEQQSIVLSNQNKKYTLEKFSSFNTNSKLKIDKLYDNRIQKLQFKDENDKKIQIDHINQERQISYMVDFALPRIFLFRSSKFSVIGSLFKKLSFDKSTDVISLQLPQCLSNQQKIAFTRSFVEIYEKHKNNYIFLVVDTDQVEELFPHLNENYPQFCIFNFFDHNESKNKAKLKSYLQNLIYPYRKHFLKIDVNEKTESLEKELRNYQVLKLQNQLKSDFLSTTYEFKQQINGFMFDQMIEQQNQSIFQIYDPSKPSTNIQYPGKIFTISQYDQSKFLPLFNKYPLYIRLAKNQNKFIIFQEKQPYNEKLFFKNI